MFSKQLLHSVLARLSKLTKFFHSLDWRKLMQGAKRVLSKNTRQHAWAGTCTILWEDSNLKKNSFAFTSLLSTWWCYTITESWPRETRETTRKTSLCQRLKTDLFFNQSNIFTLFKRKKMQYAFLLLGERTLFYFMKLHNISCTISVQAISGTTWSYTTQ